MQDHRFFESVPSGIDFEPKIIDKAARKAKLIASGYGGKPYGNGALHVFNFPIERLKKA